MNAGAYGCSMGDFAEEILITNKYGSSWFRPGLGTFSYRKSNLPEGSIVSGMRLRMAGSKTVSNGKRAVYPRSPLDSLRDIKKIMGKRVSSQPINRFSAGCVFRNPEGFSAWSLIAGCGLQGFKNGDAKVSERHANFIVNLGNARFAHVIDLIEIIKQRVEEQAGIRLKEELVIWKNESIP